MNKLLILTLIFLFIGCSQEKPKTYAKLSVSSKSFTADSNEQVILYAINKDKNEQRALILDQNSVGLDLEFGNWQFVTLSWEEDEFSQSVLKCGKALKNFNQVEDSLSIYMSSESCDDDLFASADFRSIGSIKDLKLINCQDITGLTAGQYCNHSDRGFAGSYRLSVLGHPQMSRNSLSSLTLATADKISSDCISSTPNPSSITTAGIKIPLGSSEFKAPFLIEVFEGASCEGTKKEYFFPHGPSFPLPGTRSALHNTENSADLYLEYGKVFLAGMMNFGQRLLNQPASMTVVFKNASSVALTGFSATIGAPFTIQSNSCSDSVPKKGSCLISLGFTPTGEQSYSQNLSINYKKEGVSQSLTQAISGLGVTNMAPVATGFVFGNVPEESPVAVPLPFTDNENDTPTSCSINSMSHVTIMQSCNCSAYGCFVSVKGDQDYSGVAEFTYSVVTNGMTSNVSTVSMTFTAEDDAPVVSVFSPPEAYEDSQNLIMLSYYDAENDVASECNIHSTQNVMITQACSCLSGICTVGLTGTSEFSGIANFSYSVTASNGVTSNVQSIYYSIMPLDDAPVVPSVISMAGSEDLSINVQLPFFDAEGDAPSACSVTDLSNLDMTSPCSCQGNICSVGVKGSSNYSGQASFNFSVTANGKTSNLGTANLSISPIDDAPVITSVTPANFNEDAVATLNIAYSDAENNVPSICHIQSVTSLSIVQACTCSIGQCSMQVIGSPPNFSGYAYMSLNLTANDLTSQSFNTLFLINSVDDAPVVTDIYPTGVFEDTLKTITFTYTDVDGPLNAICNLSSPSNTVFAGPCTCTGNSCSASFKSIQDYNGAGSFNYTVTTNGVTSNTGTVSFTYQAVDDAPVATTTSYRWVNTEYTEPNVVLKYRDIENSFASSCSIKSKYNFSNVGTCSCDNTGTCSATNLGSSLDDYFYTVTVNGLESNIGTIIKQNYYPNHFISMPLDLPGNRSLSSNSVNNVFFFNNKIYAATSNGLSISADGGKSFRVMSTSTGLASNVINDVFVNQNYIYLATDSGVSIISINNEQITNLSSGLPNSNVNSLFVTPDGRIFAATNGGVGYSDLPSTGSVPYTFYSLTNGLGSSTVKSIFVDSTGKIFAGTGGGLSIATSLGSSFSNYTSGLSSSNIKSIAFDPTSSRIYVATAGELAYSTNGGMSFTSLLSGEANDVFVQGNSIFVAKNNGFFVSNNSGTSFVQSNQGLVQFTVKGISISANNEIYLATSYGLAKKTGTANGFILSVNAISQSNNIWADNFGKIYVSTDLGVAISQNLGRSFRLVSAGLPSSTVKDVLALDGSMVFVATAAGLAKSNDGGENFTVLSQFNDISINSISFKNGVIYLATSLGVYKSINWGSTFTNHTSGLGSLSVNSVTANATGTIYAATNYGLSISTNGGSSFTNYNLPTTEIINDVLPLNDAILIATNDSFGFMNTDMDTYTFIDSISAKGLFQDQSGVIYVSTNQGLYSGILIDTSFTQRNTDFGLPSSNVYGTPYVSNDGQLYVATASGPAISPSNAYLAFTDSTQKPISQLSLGTFSASQGAVSTTFRLRNFGNVETSDVNVDIANNLVAASTIQSCSPIAPNNSCEFVFSFLATGPLTGAASPTTFVVGGGSVSYGDSTFSNVLEFTATIEP